MEYIYTKHASLNFQSNFRTYVEFTMELITKLGIITCFHGK